MTMARTGPRPPFYTGSGCCAPPDALRGAFSPPVSAALWPPNCLLHRTVRIGIASALVLGFLCWAVVCSTGAETPSITAKVALEYREFKSDAAHPGLIGWGLNVERQMVPFKREPKSHSGNVLRGKWSFGGSVVHSLGWLWDPTEGKLYIDLNRNQDLTDDAAGVYSCREKGRGSVSVQQTFPEVRLTFKTEMGEHRVMGDVSLYNYSAAQLWTSFAPRSYWSGRFSARGREWEVGLVEALTTSLGKPEGGYLVVRRWETREEPFELQNGGIEGFTFCREVFFGKQNYTVDCVYAQQNGTPGFELTLKEKPMALGELRLTGQYIKRLLLHREGGSATVVLDTPGAVAQVPIGRYAKLVQVALKQGGVEAYRQISRDVGSTGRFVVSSNQPMVLEVGGPLTNSLAVSRRSHVLGLQYQLVGAGGEAYRLQGERKQPEFSIYRANKKIASGKFEFG